MFDQNMNFDFDNNVTGNNNVVDNDMNIDINMVNNGYPSPINEAVQDLYNWYHDNVSLIDKQLLLKDK